MMLRTLSFDQLLPEIVQTIFAYLDVNSRTNLCIASVRTRHLCGHLLKCAKLEPSVFRILHNDVLKVIDISCNHLTELDVSHCFTVNAALLEDVILKCSKIRSLNIVNTGLPFGSLCHVLPKLTELTKLHWSFLEPPENPFQLIRIDRQLGNLTSMYVEVPSVGLVSIYIALFLVLQSCTRLDYLHIHAISWTYRSESVWNTSDMYKPIPVKSDFKDLVISFDVLPVTREVIQTPPQLYRADNFFNNLLRDTELAEQAFATMTRAPTFRVTGRSTINAVRSPVIGRCSSEFDSPLLITELAEYDGEHSFLSAFLGGKMIEGVGNIRQLYALEVVQFEAKLCKDSLEELLICSGHLVELNISRYHDHQPASEVFRLIADSLPFLRQLSIAACLVASQSPQSSEPNLSHLKNMGLVDLHVCGTFCTDRHKQPTAEMMNPLKSFQHLEQLTVTALPNLRANLSWAPSTLKVIRLSRLSSGSFSASSLQFPHLRVLRVDDVDLSASFIAVCDFLKGLCELQMLCLSHDSQTYWDIDIGILKCLPATLRIFHLHTSSLRSPEAFANILRKKRPELEVVVDSQHFRTTEYSSSQNYPRYFSPLCMISDQIAHERARSYEPLISD